MTTLRKAGAIALFPLWITFLAVVWIAQHWPDEWDEWWVGVWKP